ncbi:MAG: MarR family winged helix-turn-helix transcriptional regulator [Planctomycetota bacterium]|jgi:DNA-binding MarR family transcriptional regulator|nr:MarR family winged helix-turn-helix transcriptional regulator [Planctomycetota bacterium]
MGGKKVPIPREPCACIILRRIAQKATDFYDQALEPVALSVNQYSLLVNVARKEGCGTGELARRVGLEKSTLVRTLEPLIRDGFVTDEAPAASRSRCFFLTLLGVKALEKALPLWQRAQEGITARLGMGTADLLRLRERFEARGEIGIDGAGAPPAGRKRRGQVFARPAQRDS